MQAAKLAIACHINANTYAVRSAACGCHYSVLEYELLFKVISVGPFHCATLFGFEIKTKTNRNGKKLSHKAQQKLCTKQKTDIDSWLNFCSCCCSLKLLQLFLAYSVTGVSRESALVCVFVPVSVFTVRVCLSALVLVARAFAGKVARCH